MANDGETLTPLPEGHRAGLIAASFLGFLSFISTTALFLHLTARLIKWKLAKPPAECSEDVRILTRDSPVADQHFIQPPMSDEEMGLQRGQANGKACPNQLLFLVYNLLLADMQQSLAHILSAVWVHRDGIFSGTSTWVPITPIIVSLLPSPKSIRVACHAQWNHFNSPTSDTDANFRCWTQGWFISTGDLSSSAFTVGIALHTFLFLVYGYKASQRTLYIVTLCLWVFVYAIPITGIVVTGNGREVGGFYARAIAWCWINERLAIYRLWTRYLWVFFSLLFTSLGYILVFFYVKHSEQGVCCAHGSRVLGRITTRNAGYHPGFLLYPIIYILCAAPLGICRVIGMSGKAVDAEYYCFAAAMMASNGWMHVLLFSLTRGSILFYGSPAMVDIGLDTFAFMRTPRRRFGNMVWVQGGLQPSQSDCQDDGTRWPRWKLTSQRLHRSPRRSTGTGEETLDMRHHGIAIQVDTVTRVQVENN